MFKAVRSKEQDDEDSPSSPPKKKMKETSAAENSSCWANLPEEILVKIFSRFPHKEKRAPRLVCRNWESAMHAPTLWRHCTYDVGKNDSYALAFADRYAAYMKTLIMYFDDTEAVESILRETPSIPKEFFDKLAQKTQLQHFLVSLRGLNEQRFSSVISAIEDFIKTQKSLKRLIFVLGNDIEDDSALHLFESAVEESRMTIKDLKIMHLCSAKPLKEPCSLVRFNKLISSLKNLKFLHVDCRYIDSSFLKSLVQSPGSKLEHLKVFCNDYWFAPKLTSNDCVLLRKTVKKISVNFFFLNPACNRNALPIELAEFLPKQMPLESITYNTRSRDDRDVNGFLNYLTENFYGDLKSCSIDINYEVVNLEESLMQFMRKCGKLSMLNIKAILPVNFIENVSQFYLAEKTSLKNIVINLKNAAAEADVALKKILETYEPQLKKRGLVYHFSANGA